MQKDNLDKQEFYELMQQYRMASSENVVGCFEAIKTFIRQPIISDILYQTVDSEGDIWCNKCLMFSSKEKAQEFFEDQENILKALEIDLEEGDCMHSYKQHFASDGAELPFKITFFASPCGNLELIGMLRGTFIQ